MRVKEQPGVIDKIRARRFAAKFREKSVYEFPLCCVYTGANTLRAEFPYSCACGAIIREMFSSYLPGGVYIASVDRRLQIFSLQAGSGKNAFRELRRSVLFFIFIIHDGFYVCVDICLLHLLLNSRKIKSSGFMPPELWNFNQVYIIYILVYIEGIVLFTFDGIFLSFFLLQVSYWCSFDNNVFSPTTITVSILD